MSTITKILKCVGVFRDANGNSITGNLDAAAVIGTGNVSVQTHMDDANKHLTTTERGYLTNAGNANGVAIIGATGVLPVSVIPGEAKEVRVVADIAARDAITEKFAGLSVFVKTATADSSVTSGGAYYLWDGTAWVKTAESESLDVVLSWANIQDKPLTDSELTDIATKKHNHANQVEVLDKLTTLNNKLQFNGNDVGNTLLASKLVTAIPEVWPADVRVDGVLYLVDAI